MSSLTLKGQKIVVLTKQGDVEFLYTIQKKTLIKLIACVIYQL